MTGIITADWHIRPDKPRCRRDADWESFQEACVKFLVDEANSYGCKLVIVGDLFNTPNVPARLITMLINQFSRLNEMVYLLAGNHDLPYHSSENIDNSSIGILMALSKGHVKINADKELGKLGIYSNFNDEETGTDTGIVFTHTLTFPDMKSIPPNVDAVTAEDLLAKYPKAKWIFTGDMHMAFWVVHKGRNVLNPGCLNRQVADYKDYKPQAWFVDTDRKLVEPVIVPDDADMVDDEYLRAEEEREDRIGAFIDTVKKSGKVTLSFVDNMRTAIEGNRKTLDKATVSTIHELMEE